MTTRFDQFGLSEPTMRAIQELNYEEPTPIQARTIGPLMDRNDVIAQAQTGTGKTAAFALPIIELLEPNTQHPQALVLTPTRELAMQVAEAFRSYGKYQQLSIVPVYGGQPITRQFRALKQGVQVVVGTPGRILDHINRGTLKLEHVRMVVLDEADEMLDMGFIEDIESILRETPTERQTALFSATMPAPIVKLAKRYMQTPEHIKVETQQVTVPQIRQIYFDVGSRDKLDVLIRALDFEQPESAIIFCRTKSEVDSLGERLIARAFAAETLHGDLSQIQRDRVMGRFRTNQVKLLIATDVAARGLDIDHVSHVINYDIPLSPEVYVHRIGRTGRAGRIGSAITLIYPRERRALRSIERVIGSRIERLKLPTLADIAAKRRESFRTTLESTLTDEDLEPYMRMAETLIEKHDPVKVAAAAFKILLGNTLEEGEDTLAAQEPKLKEEHINDSPKNQHRRKPSVDSGMTRLFLDVGSNDGVRPGDIVGAIANEAGIPGRAIGEIELFERFSFVDVPTKQSKKILRALSKTRVRGNKIAPSVARPKR